MYVYVCMIVVCHFWWNIPRRAQVQLNEWKGQWDWRCEGTVQKSISTALLCVTFVHYYSWLPIEVELLSQHLFKYHVNNDIAVLSFVVPIFCNKYIWLSWMEWMLDSVIFSIIVSFLESYQQPNESITNFISHMSKEAPLWPCSTNFNMSQLKKITSRLAFRIRNFNYGGGNKSICFHLI